MNYDRSENKQESPKVVPDQLNPIESQFAIFRLAPRFPQTPIIILQSTPHRLPLQLTNSEVTLSSLGLRATMPATYPRTK